MLGRPYQFVGGWRMSNASRHYDLQDCLSQIVGADQKCSIKKSSDWAIAYLGADALPSEAAIALSACGRPDHQDIWINLETEELRLGKIVPIRSHNPVMINHRGKNLAISFTMRPARSRNCKICLKMRSLTKLKICPMSLSAFFYQAALIRRSWQRCLCKQG